MQRGQLLLQVDALKDWKAHLDRMNEGKRGWPYDCPDVMILPFGMMRVAFQLPYRQLEGFARGLGKILDLPAPDYSTLNIRLSQVRLDPRPHVDPDESVTVAVDSSGVQLVESFFAAFKQLFGHRVMSHNWLNVINELCFKAWL